MIIYLSGANFGSSNIGTLSTWTIRTSLGTGATSSNTVTSVDKGAAYNATVTIAEGYELGAAGVTVTMGGSAVTSGITVSGNTITISIGAVTGDVVITVPTKNTATGEEDDPETPVDPPSSGTTTTDITSQFTFTEGKMINASNGTESSYSGWVASDYVDISAYSSIEIKMSKTSSTNTGTGLAFYDADKTYISGVPHTDGVASYGVMVKELDVPNNAKYVRTTYWSTSNSNYQSSYGDFYCKGITETATPNPTPNPGGEQVDITSQFNFIESRMISVKDGKISTWDGWVANEDYVDISNYSSIEIKMSKTNSPNTGTGLALYDADKNFISGIPHTDGVATYGTMIKTIEILDNIKYVRTTYWSTSNANYNTEFGDFYCKATV